MCRLEINIEIGPGFVNVGHNMPFADVPGKMVDFVMMMMPMLINCVGVSAALAASAMLAYLLIAVKIVTMGRSWL